MAAGFSVEIENWLRAATQILISSWGLESSFAIQVAKLYLYFLAYGLQPTITSGFRSPEYQKELIRRWEAGDSSIIVKPAQTSKHSNMKLNKPAAIAVDISTNNHKMAAMIAEALGLKSGYYFSKPDGVHFYV